MMKRIWTLGLTLGLMGALSISTIVHADAIVTDPQTSVEPVSFVTLDVGTELELTLDDNNTVIEVTPLDPEGTDLIPEDGFAGLPVDEAVDQLIDGAIENGLLPEDGSIPVEIGVGSDDPAAVEEITDALTDVTEDVPAEESPVPVVFQNAALERIAMARELGITPGKLNLIQKYAASTGSPETVVLQDWTQKPVKEIMGAIKANRKVTPVSEDAVTDTDTTGETAVDTVTQETSSAAAPAPAKDSKPKSKGSNKSAGGKKK